MTLLPLGLAALLLAGQSTPAPPAAGRLRFHHVHLRTGDPAAAMTSVISRAGGTRVILQGLGVGVRVDDVYVLFDRAPDAPAPAGNTAFPDLNEASTRYAAAVRWLQARHFDVGPLELSATRTAALAPEGGVDHLAFATTELAGAVTALQRAGFEPLKRTGESVMFDAGGIVVEIVRDTGRADAFWCPMHPEIRSASTARCPLCSMELVPIPPPTLGHYRLDVGQIPKPVGSGTRALRIAIRHPETSDRVTALTEIHERLLHLFVVGRDLSYFAHVHPERSGDGFEVPIDLSPGAYVVIADFVPTGGTPQLVQHAIVTPGYPSSPFAVATVKPDLGDKIAEGVRVSLSADDPRAGREAALRFTVRDATAGAVVTNLEPYLGAAGHLLVVSADVTHAIHAHPESSPSATARQGEIVFAPVMPAPGIYKLWVQFQRHGKVITAPFAIAVR